MKKKILIGVSSVFVIILCICICFYVSKSNDNEIYQAKVKEKVENQVGGFLTLMLETEAGSGEYQESTSGTWPGDGYVFNSELSSCENGGELSWNSETNTINLLSNKSDACYVYFDVYESPTLANYIINNVYVEDGVNGLYYHDGQGTYTNADQEAGDYSYRYSGGDYEIAEAYQGTYSQVYGEIIKKNCDGIEDTTFYQYCYGTITYELDYDTNNAQYTTVSEALEQAVRDGYLIGDNIKNYVCFGSTESPCPEENLYRIIGVFDNEVKLIKSDYNTSSQTGTDGDYYGFYTYYDLSRYIGNLDFSSISTYYWNGSANNTWSESPLNTVNLNTNFLNNIGSTWSNLIATQSWKVGGGSLANLSQSNVQTAYNYEVGSNSSSTTYSAKVGLMYLSDYYYAATNTYWTYSGFAGWSADDANSDYRVATDSNWMYMGLYEWTISRSSDTLAYAFCIHWEGRIMSEGVGSGMGVNYAIRPVFYLNSDVEYASGDGSIDNPYRLVV